MSATLGHKDPEISLLAFLQGEYPVGQAWANERVKEVHAEPVNPRGDASYAVLTELSAGNETLYRIYTGRAEIRRDPKQNLYWSDPNSIIYNPHDAAVPAAWLNLPLGYGAGIPSLERWTERAAAHALKITALHTPGSALLFDRVLIGGYFYRSLQITAVETREDGQAQIWVEAGGKRVRLPDEARHGPFEVVRLGWPESSEQQAVTADQQSTRPLLDEHGSGRQV